MDMMSVKYLVVVVALSVSLGVVMAEDKCAPILHVIQNMANTPCGQNFCQIYGNNNGKPQPPTPYPQPPTPPIDGKPQPTDRPLPPTLPTARTNGPTPPTPPIFPTTKKPTPPTLPTTKSTTTTTTKKQQPATGGPWGVDSSSTWWGSENCKCAEYPGQSGWNCQGQCYTTQAECVDAQFNEKHCKNKVYV